MNGPRAVVIVDGFTATGRLLASRFLAQAISCIQVLSKGDFPKTYVEKERAGGCLQDSLYEMKIVFSGDLGAVIRELEGYTVIGVIPGSGTGISLADALSERMHLCTNGTRRSAARHDKFLMQQTLIDAGVPTKEFIRTSDETDLLAWYRSRRFEGIVIKPVNRASGREILFCRSEEDVVRAFRALHGTMNDNGEENSEVLAEECLAGTEYCVETVSRDGKHRLAGIRECKKEGPAGSSGGAREEEIAHGDRAEVVRYTVSTLDALRIRYGAASTKIMMTEDGPLLIDAAAWMNGGTVPPGPVAGDFYHRKADLVVEAYCDPEGFRRSPALPGPGSEPGQKTQDE
jgi:hypothetical protein